nr:ABC transporter I family member 1 [Tanacetum cinerariifolium]
MMVGPSTGANGSGKSTFLRMLAGFFKPSAGEILWSGHDITQSGVFHHQYKLQLNWLSLKEAIKSNFTVLDNVQERLQLARVIAMDRPIWLLDEPSVAFDDEGVKLLEQMIADHRSLGGIVIVGTHLPIQTEDAMFLRLPPRFSKKDNFS